jgi:hypothetical protein
MNKAKHYHFKSDTTSSTFSKTINIALDQDVIVEYLPQTAIDGDAWLNRFNDNIPMFRFELLNLIDTIVGNNTNCRISIPKIELLKLKERIDSGILSNLSKEERGNLFSKSSKKINGIIEDVLAMYPGLFDAQTAHQN